MFGHEEPLILLQTVKNTSEGVLFLKTTSSYCTTSLKKKVFFTFFNDINGSSSQIIFNFAMHLDQQHHNSTAIWHFRCLTSTRIETWNMHTEFYEVFLNSDKPLFCYEVFERNDLIETTGAHFFKKVR